MTATAEQLDASARFMDAAERVPTPLYKIPYAVEATLDKLERGEITEADAEAEFDLLAGEFRMKALGAAAVITNYLSTAGQCDAEIARLEARRAKMEKRADWLQGYVLRCMQAIPGLREIPGGAFSIAIKTNPPHVEVVEQALIPSEFMRQPATPKAPPLAPDKDKIKLHFKETKADVPGTRVVQDEVLVIS